MIELNNGCLCCTVRGDLVSGIGELLASGRPIDRLVIETSGLADPAPVIQSFVLDEVLRRRVALDAIVTVVDARHLPDQLAHDEAREQIAFADLVLVNKLDLVDADGLAAVERAVRGLNPLARIRGMREGRIDRREVLDLGAFDLQNLLRLEPDLLADHEHEHSDEIGCVALTIVEPLAPDAFNAWLNRFVQDHGPDLLRMKGILAFAGDRRRFVFHGVHMTLDGRPGRPWGTEAAASRLVLIGRNLDAERIRREVEACRAMSVAVA